MDAHLTGRRAVPARVGLIVAADALVLALSLRPALSTVRHPDQLRTPDTDRLAVSLAQVGLCALASWLALGLAVGLLARTPGAAGALAARVQAVLLPAAVRRLLAGGVGLGVLLAPVAATAAPCGGPSGPPTWPTSGQQASPAPPGTTPSRPVRTSPRPGPTSARPGPTSARPDPTPGAGPEIVTVRTGDSLWSLAADRLRTGGAAPPEAAVASYWPAVYAANRDVIGTDPDLIHPGQHLHLPDPSGSGPADPKE